MQPRHSRTRTEKAVSALPATATLPAVATDPATATLPAVATDPATATLPAVATDPATATAPVVATDPATATLPAVAGEPATATLAEEEVFTRPACQASLFRGPGSASITYTRATSSVAAADNDSLRERDQVARRTAGSAGVALN